MFGINGIKARIVRRGRAMHALTLGWVHRHGKWSVGTELVTLVQAHSIMDFDSQRDLGT